MLCARLSAQLPFLHKVNRSRNIAGMGDVHVSASKGVILRVQISDMLLQLRVEKDR